MTPSVQSVSMAAADIQQMLVQAVAQILERSTQVALLNLETQTGAGPEGVGEQIDITV